MKPMPFEYCRPATLDETFDLLARFGDDGRILAGGQSLVPALNMRLATPRAIVDINRLPGLDAIRLTPEGLAIGALARARAADRRGDAARGPCRDPHARHVRGKPGPRGPRSGAAGMRRRA